MESWASARECHSNLYKVAQPLIRKPEEKLMKIEKCGGGDGELFEPDASLSSEGKN